MVLKNTNIAYENIELPCRPILKWAGGKSQLLSELLPKIPKKYGKFIEPFFGGGALFFAARPKQAIIADSNPELINLYQTVASDVASVIKALGAHINTEEAFYEVRAQDPLKLTPAQAAARTIYLNKTCFNGLYRVNRKGQFNTPFGRYKTPRFLDEENLRATSALLRNATIVLGDYKAVLKEYAKPGDFIFLDPPYLPISVYADFKRYTKEQFLEEDHCDLATEIQRLHDLGCHIILTNSNHPLVAELYGKYGMEVISTRRHISCNGNKRIGEDVIVDIKPPAKLNLKLLPTPLSQQASVYPPTRFMGSKSKLLKEIWSVASQFRFDTAVDLFSGSGIVGYMFKAQQKRVISNDHMAMSACFTKAMVENNNVTLSNADTLKLLEIRGRSNHFVETTFKDLYFTDEDNQFIDNLRANIKGLRNPYKKAIAMTALIRACTKKRPRGIFTYTGMRYDDGRRDIHLGLREQFLEAVEIINTAVFDNHKDNKSRQGDAMALPQIENALVYIDPPYYTPLGDNEYVRRYHFIEGLARDWQGVEIQEHTQTKKFKSYPTPFSTRKGAADAFDYLFKKFKNNILLVSYSSNSLPNQDEMVSIMSKYKKVEVVPVNYKYSFGNQGNKVGNNNNDVKEYIFVGY
ncbi:MAG: Dam family site-specific DNA-(adenine-N6)-methyltransferase [Erysipelotrichia bacterium]|nr:Dam family site-specific DNA-(adenine-N6)-methyltransferase [Erysipelotrichia bacterium]